MNEHFDAQINAFPQRRTPMMLFYGIVETVEDTPLIRNIAYEGVGDVRMPDGFEFVGMNGAIPIFKKT